MNLVVNQLSDLASGDVDVALFDDMGNLWAASGTVDNPEVISAAGLPAGDYYVMVYYYDNDSATAASTTYDILLTLTSGTGCATNDDCAGLIGHGYCDTGVCVNFDGAGAQEPGEFCDDDEDCNTATTGSSFYSGFCFTADPVDADDNMCIVDCDTEADCTDLGMHCTILAEGSSPAGICLPPCTSDAGCGGLTCNTTTSTCESNN